MSHATTKVASATSRVNPTPNDPSETNLDLRGSTNPAAVDTSVPAQRTHQEREALHNSDKLPAHVGRTQIEPLDQDFGQRSEKQDEDKRKLQAQGQGFAETGN
ncbi:hypothetical protein GLOTRDRAFT_96370 [Gloeophyllum trabeum ATCC 11539]|uniref:Uncharacterized protein n=1 Tax=Gloeophyllum trabeum (strain ATCC 11539 / FP-39264 / Madison 617) TaxID=670483 RepID=S7PVJ6_GLOTA|nr:uncharacterized protein GLOTRDRAFT_96370 [Gloeophyllum trabeum ATCC 11539]EPQ51656.1 hypothetical protein GLOTRDRAFT_96370 [Gloeophyllum trabeum ATCC 11539]